MEEAYKYLARDFGAKWVKTLLQYADKYDKSREWATNRNDRMGYGGGYYKSIIKKKVHVVGFGENTRRIENEGIETVKKAIKEYFTKNDDISGIVKTPVDMNTQMKMFKFGNGLYRETIAMRAIADSMKSYYDRISAMWGGYFENCQIADDANPSIIYSNLGKEIRDNIRDNMKLDERDVKNYWMGALQYRGNVSECNTCSAKTENICPCGIVGYCNEICQKSDWTNHRQYHK